MSRPAAAALLVACLVTASSAALADGDAATLLDDESVTCPTPALRVTRPNDAWQFVDLAALKAQAQAAGQDTRGYDVLRARLWHGASRADVFVRAWTDPIEREQPPEAATLIQEVFEPVRASFGDGARSSAPKGVRVGGRVGALVGIEGTLPGRGPHAVLLAVAYRPDDRTVLSVALECAPEHAKKLGKDLKKLLKKIRF